MDPNQIRGALLGLATGDALGTTNEFKPPGSFQTLTGMVGGGPFRLKPGEWTDDTSMALCLAESLIAQRGFDAKDQMDRYVRWWRNGENSVTGRCFDIGNTTRAALQQYLRTGNPFSGDPSPETAGNGSLMRLAPVVLYFSDHSAAATHYAAESSRTTHGAPQAVESCRHYARMILTALQGQSKNDILATPCDSGLPELQQAITGLGEKQVHHIKPSGYVIHSIEAALWCFATSEDFATGCLKAANLGGDADTIAAIFGQLAGAYYGADSIPAEWLNQLAWRERIELLADKLNPELRNPVSVQ